MPNEDTKFNPSDKAIKLVISTKDYLITGSIFLPQSIVVKNPTKENLLFYALNCGNKFIALYDVIVSNRNTIEYKPEHFNYYNINLDIVHSCRILDDE
jgi:hypothetical protein